MACAESQTQATPTKTDVFPARLEGSLYPNWAWKQDTRPKGSDLPRPYKTPKEDNRKVLTLEEELDAKSMFDPLVPGSQSSQPPNSQSSMAPDTTTEVAGPKTPPHFCKAPVYILPFDLALIGMPAVMSPITEGENTLLNLAPGSPVNNLAAAGIGHGTRGSGQSSCSNCPMSLGSPAHLVEHWDGPKDTGPSGHTSPI